MLDRTLNHARPILLALLVAVAAGPVAAVSYQISFAGPEPTAHGLTVAGGAGVGHLAVTAGGRACWATNWRAGEYKIAVQVPLPADAPRPAPIRVTITYLDFGWGQWALEYEAWDGAQAQRRHGPVVQKRNTATWREAEFSLPDFSGTWLAVDSFGAMVDEDDEYLGEITVRPGGPAILSPAPVLAAGEKHVLQAAYWNPDYLPRMWSIELKASAGIVQELTMAGPKPGDFQYTAPAVPGPVTLEARVDEVRSAQRLLIWRGHSPVQVESTLIDPTNALAGWMYWPFAARVTLATVAPEAEAGAGGAWLAYTFTGPYRPGYVDLTRRTFLRGLPLDVNLQVQGDSGGARLQAILEDASGQRFCYDLGPVQAKEWAALRGNVQGPARYWGGAQDGTPRYPLYFLSLRVLQGPEGSSTSGGIWVRDVFVRTMAPTP
jgi:hypothetical protein